MKEETIIILPEDMEILDASDYKAELEQHFNQVPEMARPLLKEAKKLFAKIEKGLYTTAS